MQNKTYLYKNKYDLATRSYKKKAQYYLLVLGNVKFKLYLYKEPSGSSLTSGISNTSEPGNS